MIQLCSPRTIAALARLFLVAFAFVLSACSCAPDGPPASYSPEAWKYRKPLKKSFKPVDGSQLQLIPLNDGMICRAGEMVEVTFRLVNRGKRPVQVFEWMMNTNDNLKVYYRLRKDDLTATFDPSLWQCELPVTEEIPLRFELVLNPGNAVLISRKLTFVKKLEKPVSPQQYQLIGATNLTSLDVKSSVFTITVQ